jgi:catechol 2,3-dioxygenase-like lactoylglutathione lyase family enzyme
MISHIDHMVLTVRDVARSAEFYSRVFDMEIVTFGAGRRALRFGNQKINLQTLGQETRNYAGIGSADVCLVTGWSLDRVVSRLQGEGVEILEGPVSRTGAIGPMTSVYFNDPDGNLLEVSVYD